MKNIPMPMDSYESTRSKALKKIKSAAESSGDEVLNELADEMDPVEVEARRANIEAVRLVVDHCLDDYREGEYDFKEAKKMICNAISKLK